MLDIRLVKPRFSPAVTCTIDGVQDKHNSNNNNNKSQEAKSKGSRATRKTLCSRAKIQYTICLVHRGPMLNIVIISASANSMFDFTGVCVALARDIFRYIYICICNTDRYVCHVILMLGAESENARMWRSTRVGETRDVRYSNAGFFFAHAGHVWYG